MDKFEKYFESADYYTAHQMILSSYRRLSKMEKKEEARTLLYEGAFKLACAAQAMSSHDLCAKYVEIMEPDLTELSIKKLAELITKLSILDDNLGKDILDRIFKNIENRDFLLECLFENRKSFLIPLDALTPNLMHDLIKYSISLRSIKLYKSQAFRSFAFADGFKETEIAIILIYLISDRQFLVANHLIKDVIISLNIAFEDGPMCPTPYRLINFAQLLFLLAARRVFPKSSYEKITAEYQNYISPQIALVLSSYEASFIKSHTTNQAPKNPMLDLFKDLFSAQK